GLARVGRSDALSIHPGLESRTKEFLEHQSAEFRCGVTLCLADALFEVSGVAHTGGEAGLNIANDGLRVRDRQRSSAADRDIPLDRRSTLSTSARGRVDAYVGDAVDARTNSGRGQNGNAVERHGVT